MDSWLQFERECVLENIDQAQSAISQWDLHCAEMLDVDPDR